MDHDSEIKLLAGETVAMQWIVTQILSRLCAMHPTLRDAIGRGFDDAASGLDEVIARSGNEKAPDHITQAARIIRDLKAATLGPSEQKAN